MMNSSESKESRIIGVQLCKARELLQMTPREVAHEINVTPQEVVAWEKEESRPNLTQLEEMAELYGREIDYFLRQTQTPPENIEFRGKTGQSLKDLSKEARIVLVRLDELCRTALEFESLLNRRPPVKLPHFKETDPPKTVAQDMRREFGLKDEPIPDLKNRLEDEGVRIFELPVPEDAFSGFSFWHAEYGPCILLNATEKPKGRRNFTLAHELAHLVYTHGSSLCYIPIKLGESHPGLEYIANQVAIELLLPELGVVGDFRKRNLSRTPSEKDLAPIAYKKWGVSIQAFGYRLENVGLIEKGHINSLFETEPPFRRLKKGPRPPRFERELGKRLVETSFEAYQKGLISIGKLAHGLDITIRDALKEIEKRSK